MARGVNQIDITVYTSTRATVDAEDRDEIRALIRATLEQRFEWLAIDGIQFDDVTAGQVVALAGRAKAAGQ